MTAASRSAAAFMARKNRSGRVIRETLEFRRVRDLPRRAPDPDGEVVPGQTHAQLWTPALRLRERDDNGELVELRPSQGWACSEAAQAPPGGGIVCNYPVGEGKTITSFLLPTVWEAKRPLVMLPAATIQKKTLKLDLPQARRNWFIHDNIMFVSYEAMSREKQEDFFERFMFDVVVADEAHNLRNHKAAVVRRLMRYKEKYGWVRLGFMSGTFTSRSVKDYYHLLDLALGDGSPCPRSFMDIEDWADLLDEGVEDDMRPKAGGMLQFCVAGETARQGYQRRLRETPGYLSVLNSSVDCSLYISERPIEVPKVIRDAINAMRLSGTMPSGDLVDPMEFSSRVAELINGFFYRWVWPGEPDMPWMFARRDWKRYARWVIKHSGEHQVGRNYDTEAQVARAWLKGYAPAVPHDLLIEGVRSDVYDHWVAQRERLTHELAAKFHKHMREPPREAVWISDYMMDHCVKWLQDTPRALLWVDKVAVQQRLREKGALVFGGGEDDVETETKSCAVSIDAHGTGKNLQHAYDANLFLAMLTSGQLVEQTLGRTHRQGQKSDQVTAEVFLPCVEFWNAFEQARRDAVYAEQTTAQRQKLLYADIDIPSPEEVLARSMVLPRDPLWCEDYSVVRRAA